MPLAFAIAIRYVIMAAVQLGIWWALEKYGIPLLNNAITSLMAAFRLSEEEAKSVMANKIILAFEEVGIFAVTLRTKMPIKVAEFLGFTSKGFAVRKVTLATEAKIAGLKISATSKAVTTLAEAEKVAEIVGKSRGLSVPSFATFAKVVTLVIGVPTGFFFALAQYIDFANWQGPYQRYFQNLLSYIGIHPDTPMPKASVVSADIWKRIYSTIEELNPVGISFPFENQDRPYSRQNLADQVDSIAANMVKAGGTASYKNVIGAVLLTINLTNKTRTDADIDAIFAKVGVKTTQPRGGGTTIPTVKVFTGIVSQGVVGAGLVFTPRPDDLIESVDELRTAAANNLAPFLATLAGKIVYEVKVVSSIITKDGFKQTGISQRVQTGTFANGMAKYKRVTNKFATLVVYALTDKGSRAKLTTIVLGPTDSAKLTVGQNDLRTLENALPAMVTTTDVKEIKEIKTPEAVVVTAPQQPQVVQNTYNGKTYYTNLDTAKAYAKDHPGAGAAFGYKWDINGNFLSTSAQNPEGIQTALMPVTAPVVSSTVATAPVSGVNATTLYEWYQAQGQTMPSIEARSLIYAGFGLGQASYYTGTAEQNTKLLQALKSA